MTPWVLWSMTETDTNAAPVAEDLLDLIDSYAEARHVGGCHLYNAKTAAARNAVVAALASAAAQPNTIAFMQYYETEEGINGWYLHHPQFYCDIEQQGKNSSEWSIFFRHVNGSEAYSETQAQPGADERRLRRFLCARYEFLPYMDDGEAHGQKLDWLRCTVDQIEARILEVDHERFQASAEPTPATPAPSVLEDATRYQWLRLALADRTNNGKSHWFCSIAAGHPEELDAAIDAAMAEKKRG